MYPGFLLFFFFFFGFFFFFFCVCVCVCVLGGGGGGEVWRVSSDTSSTGWGESYIDLWLMTNSVFL